ncbi:MAG: hypothetical protein C0490_14215 [Marivirga sp.]|nr:hypothetical protein [Marivirga sp.]
MKSFFLSFFLVLVVFSANAQNDSIPKKGSYLRYGQPYIEDNSMFIEEAFNQEAGIIQHISSLIIEDGNIVYAYTQEIPLAEVKHQLSFGISYNAFKTPDAVKQFSNAQFLTNGIGDLFINYRPLLLRKNDWALVIPRFSLIVPTGDARYGFGTGGWGGQFNLAVTKRLSRKMVTHFNAGCTQFSKADFYEFDSEGTPKLSFEKNISATNFGASVILFVTPRFNLLTEYVSYFEQGLQNDGVKATTNSMIINPGFRVAVDIGKVQIVPGGGIPFNFVNGQFQNSGAFIYLSIEPAY